ncbi:MAG: hypothetical protein NW223_05805 [Hyphomicrobiaceae bacterium]|nr:hypothetical protein [Hyphomicrobiaceae bacterium]
MAVAGLRLAVFCATAVLALAAPQTSVRAAEPVKRIAVYVEPFYRAAGGPGGTPHVQVGATFDSLLRSNALADINAARDLVTAKPGLVSPMTLMVLAIRYYDLGARDDAVFWFYAAKDRMLSLLEVAEPGTPALAQASHAIAAFSQLAGPVVNGYAFCDIEQQARQRLAAFRWVEANPYQAIFLDRVPARGPDRKALLGKALSAIAAQIEKERAYLADPANRKRFREDRLSSETDSRYCWR